MSIDHCNHHQEANFECDEKGCCIEEQFNGDFQECINAAKEAGWTITNEGGEWMHYCTDHNPYEF